MELTCFISQIKIREGPAKIKEVNNGNSQSSRPEAERARSMARFGIGVKKRREK
jgi:hypothetical protein